MRAGLFALAALALLGGCRKPAPGAPADAGVPAAIAALCEHRVPAELCTRCNPDLVAVFKETGDWCEEHGVPESQCFECNPKLSFDGTREPPFPAPGTKVRLASAGTARDVGIQTVKAERRRFSRTLDVVGELRFNANRHAELSARGEAIVQEVLVDVGDEVRRGQPLVRLASAAVGADQAQLSAAQSRIGAARAKLERETSLASKGISARRDVEEAQRELSAAQAEYDAARSALAATGASESGTAGRYTLSAPFDGTVVARSAVAGKSAGPGQVLIELADLSTLWAHLDVPEAEAADVRAGQRVELTLEGMRGQARDGVISRVSPIVDPRSRTFGARVELPNPERTLKAGVFVRARIVVATDQDALMIPRSAVQYARAQTLVFVKKGEALYQPQVVRLGASDGERVEVVEGLEPGTEVVTTGAFLLKTEILKDSIGAGCCETEE